MDVHFEECDPCPGHDYPPGTRVILGAALPEFLEDAYARSVIKRLLARSWGKEAGALPPALVFHVGAEIGDSADLSGRRPVSMSGGPTDRPNSA